MFQHLVVQYTMKYQKYVTVSSYTVHDAASEICASIRLQSTWRNIRNRCQYLVLQYTIKHQKYLSVSSCRVHGETSEIGASI